MICSFVIFLLLFHPSISRINIITSYFITHRTRTSHKVVMMPTFLSSSTCVFIFLSFNLLWDKLIILRQGIIYLLSMNMSMDSSLSRLYDRLIFVTLGKCSIIWIRPLLVSLFLQSLIHLMYFDFAAVDIMCKIYSSFN